MPGPFRELPVRLLTFLAKGPGRMGQAARSGKLLIEAGDRGAVSVEDEVLQWLVSEGTVRVCGDEIALSRTGFEVARDLAAARSSKNGGREIGAISPGAGTGGEARPILVNLSESPLAQLARLRTRAGKSFLAAREFEAGERLRADYTRGQIMPRLGANWIASVASGKRSGADRCVLLSERHGNGRDGTGMACQVRQGRAQDRAVRVGPPLLAECSFGRKQAGTHAALGCAGLQAEHARIVDDGT
jgi:hypothetical protein